MRGRDNRGRWMALFLVINKRQKLSTLGVDSSSGTMDRPSALPPPVSCVLSRFRPSFDDSLEPARAPLRAVRATAQAALETALPADVAHVPLRPGGARAGRGLLLDCHDDPPAPTAT